MEAEHRGKVPSSVFYIPTGPKCGVNMEYLERMRGTFLSGKTPPDFPLNNNEVNFINRATMKDLTDLGKSMMGFPEIDLHRSQSDEL